MNKIIKTLIIVICMTILLTGCNENNENVGTSDKNNVEDTSLEVIKVMEKVYMDYIYDIYLDENKYLGKTIEIEGMFTKDYNDKNNENFYVYRLTDNAHEHDDEMHTEEVMSGFEFKWNGEVPKENDWIKVVGILKKENESIIIEANSVEIMKQRGLEKVSQSYNDMY